MDGAIRCTHPNCSCDCFAPGRGSKRTCSTCQHGWISHALDKLLDHRLPHKSRVSAVSDLASLILFGTSAVPVRLKVLLDLLFSQSSEADVAQLLHRLGWTEEDFSRGYKLKDPEGNRLMRWTIVNRTEEVLVMQQFLKFPESRNIAEGLLRDSEAVASSSAAVQQQEDGMRIGAGCSRHPVPPPLDSSDIMKFIERANRESLNSSQSKCNSTTVNSQPLRSSPPHLPGIGTTCSPESTGLSPPNKRCSPSAPSLGSPLNKLQNMQPFDFRKMFSKSKSYVNPVSDSSPALDSGSLEAAYRVSKQLKQEQLMSLYSPTTAESSDTSANRNLVPGSVNSDEQSFSDGESGDEMHMSDGAMNLSLEQGGYDPKERHSRKSSNPMKRRWNPMVLSTLVTNPSTGKRRVQCHACFKTFCDKGALKIHFSAVHLREMHKCTVDGCTMMFSSRRSRNRHSANPNPKLHSSSLRRKLNPHDGRTSNPFPSPLMRDSTPGSPLLNHHLGPAPSLNQSRMLLDQQRFGDFDKIRANLTSASSAGINDVKDSFRSNSCSPCPSDTYCESEPGSSTLMKRIKSHDSRPDRRVSESNGHDRRRHQQQEEDAGLPDDERHKDQDAHQDSDANRTRKRKSANPTKFSVLHSPIAATLSDDDMQYSSDDSSSSTYGMDGKDNGMMDDGSDDDDDDDSIQEYMNRHRNHALKKMYEAHKQQQAMCEREAAQAAAQDERHQAERRPQQEEKQVHEHSSNNDKTMDLTSHRKSGSFRNERTHSQEGLNQIQPEQQQPIQDEQRQLNSKEHQADLSAPQTSSPDPHEGRENPPARKCSNDSASNALGSENPLRHLESLSLGPFSNLTSPNSHLRNSATSSLFASSNLTFPAASMGLSFGSVLPPAGLSMPKMSRSSDQSDLRQEMLEDYEDGDSASRGDGESGQEDSTPTPGDGGSISSHMFRDSSLSSFGLDIPVDKENPRRCTACGKIFQNHFGVKTHYQNVHLKLMHKCTVDGCNAAFPSKRSRDRHSANLNLHRKLLSTHSDKGLPFSFGDKNSPFFPYGPPANLRDDFLSRFYDPQGLPLNLGDLYHGRLPPIGPDGLLAAAAAAGFSGLPAGFPSPFALSLPPHLPGVSLTNQEGHVAERDSPASSAGSSSSTPNSSAKYSPSTKSKGSSRRSPQSPDQPHPPQALAEHSHDEQLATGKLECSHCKFCSHSADVLQDHYAKHHPAELHKCSSRLCNKTFLSRADRKRHERTFHEKENNSQQPQQLSHHHHRRALLSSNDGTETEDETPARDLSPGTTRNQASAAVCEISC